MKFWYMLVSRRIGLRGRLLKRGKAHFKILVSQFMGVLLSAGFLSACSPSHDGQTASAPLPSSNVSAMTALIADVCDKRIVALGENGSHADGTTIAFKAELTQRLVSECGFNTVFFEASFYDFKAIEILQHRGVELSAELLLSALGGIHNKNAEIAPLIPFLLSGMTDKTLTVTGLDYQLGSAGAFYSIDLMPKELASFLSSDGSADDTLAGISGRCEALIKSRIYWSFPKGTPYDAAYRGRIKNCLTAIKSAIPNADLSAYDAEIYLNMIENIALLLEHDFRPPKDQVPGRDFAMYLNLQHHILAAPKADKHIIWSTNTHLANDFQAMPIYAEAKNLGSYIHAEYGEDAAAIGFSALGGETRFFDNAPKALPVKSEDALERVVIETTHADTVYLDSDSLKRQGRIAASLYSHRAATQDWSQSFDAIIVFKEEAAAKRVERVLIE